MPGSMYSDFRTNCSGLIDILFSAAEAVRLQQVQSYVQMEERFEPTSALRVRKESSVRLSAGKLQLQSKVEGKHEGSRQDQTQT